MVQFDQQTQEGIGLPDLGTVLLALPTDLPPTQTGKLSHNIMLSKINQRRQILYNPIYVQNMVLSVRYTFLHDYPYL